MQTEAKYQHLERSAAREALEKLIAIQPHVYHGTTRDRLRSIRSRGLDPSYEHSQSSYHYAWEEPPAIRLAIDPAIAIQTANSRSQKYDDVVGFMVVARPVLLRFKTELLLTKEIGIDHSFAPMQAEFKDLQGQNTTPLNATTFLGLIKKHRIFSTYTIIELTAIECSTAMHPNGAFVAVLEFNDIVPKF